MLLIVSIARHTRGLQPSQLGKFARELISNFVQQLESGRVNIGQISALLGEILSVRYSVHETYDERS